MAKRRECPQRYDGCMVTATLTILSALLAPLDMLTTGNPHLFMP